MTQDQMALRTGKERSSVTNFLRLLKLPIEVQDMLESGELSFGHARALLKLPAELISLTARRIRDQDLSVRKAEADIDAAMNPVRRTAEEKLEPEADPNVRDAEDRLQRSLGLKVRIEDNGGSGRVVIEYATVEDFDAILDALGGE